MSKVTLPFEIECKRLYVPKTIEVICPTCWHKNDIDLGDQYLSYPLVNEPNNESCECEECENEFSYILNITMDIEVKQTDLK